jgi:hypothetical protein
VTVAWTTEPEDFRRRAGVEAGPIAGVAHPARGEVVLYAPALMSRPDRIVSVLRHEVWHLVFARATAGAAVEPPRWLDEGIATWRSGEWDLDLELRRDRAAGLRDAAAAGRLVALDDLDGRFPDGAHLPLAYAQSASFVEWLAARGGEEKLVAVLRELDRDVDPAPAFAAVYGTGLAELEGAWRAHVAPGGALGRLPSVATLSSLAGLVLGVLLIVGFVRKRRRLSRLSDAPPDTPG